jgi:hypothetical protein
MAENAATRNKHKRRRAKASIFFLRELRVSA